MRYGLNLFLTGVMMAGCAASRGEQTLSEEQKTLLGKIETYMKGDPCDADNKHRCTFETVTFGDNTVPAERDQVIMIIDEGLKIPSLALHASRVIAHFKGAAGPDYYIAHKPSAPFPAGAIQILHRFFKGKEELASSKPFQALGEIFTRKYGKLFEGNNMGHGTTSFNILAELNPQAKFVMVHTDAEFHRPPLCDLNRTGGEAALAQYWKDRAAAIAKIARDYRVKFVNYSMGYDLRAARDMWRKLGCRGRQPNDDVLRRLVTMTNAIPERLNEIPGLLFTQSAPYPDGPLDEDGKKDFSADCQSLPQRLRVGYLNVKNNTLNEADTRRHTLLSPTMSNAFACTDLYVRDGLAGDFESTVSPIYYTGLGFGHGAMNMSGTSFIAPVGLAHAAYLMKTKNLTPAQLLETVRGRNNEPLLAAPFANKEFLNQNRLYLNWPE